jgi:hypothetical protein
MVNPLLQKARQRKMIYFGAIVALFTLSLIHREFVVHPQATRLQLRETARGEVDLTSSAVCLLTTGSRGLAVTFLWHTALEYQKRNEWSELELVVKSITKLQPYFIVPWLYQSWNLSFNVAVECDRPRDKYYYISRGLELLAEGERRNSGTAGQGVAADPDRTVPGNPELRQFMGFIYQLKIGNSDERLTMRSLLEMSCIDPIQRNPERFWTNNEKGEKIVELKVLEDFCQKYPRLVRRLYEQLEYTDPQRIVQFLQDHQKIPSRFKPIEKTSLVTPRESELKDPLEQFPILPPKEGKWPDPLLRDLTGESIDVFLVSRTWYEYAQKPLPPPDKDAGLEVANYNPLRYRVPKGMMLQIFRSYPARAQIFIAEALESEGFFDSDGWDMSAAFKKWRSPLTPGRDIEPADYTYGTDPKYYSRNAWKEGYERYREFGIDNGIYLSPADVKELNEKAAEVRERYNLKPDERLPVAPELRTGRLRESARAHEKLSNSAFYRNLCNFDSFLYQAEGECDPIAIAMRKNLFFAERKRKRETPSEATMELYEEAWDSYLQVCFKYPRFAQVASMQEDLYETHIRSLGIAQQLNRDKFKQAAFVAAKFAYVPFPTCDMPVPNWHQWFIQVALVGEREKAETPFWVAKLAYVPIPRCDMPVPNWHAWFVQFALVGARERDWRRLEDQLVIEKEGEQQVMLKVVPIRNRYGSLARVEYYDGPAAKELKEALFIASSLATFTPLWASCTPPMGIAPAILLPGGRQNFLLTRRTEFREENVREHWRFLISEDARRLVNSRLGLDR